MRKKIRRSFIVQAVLQVLFNLFCWYFFIPALNIASFGFQFLIIVNFLIVLIVGFILDDLYMDDCTGKVCKIGGGATLIAVVFFLVTLIGSSSMFQSLKLSSLVEVNTENFEDRIEEVESVEDIALMDSETAKNLADRKMGGLGDLISSYGVSNHITTICLNGKPMKVAPLEYNGFFKWNANKEDGIPGYILIDPVNNTAEFVKTKNAIKYSPSSYFSQDLSRTLRFYNHSALYGKTFFEIDDDGNMYWVTPILKNKAFFGGRVPYQVVLTDAVTGECTTYNLKDVPTWVDIVFDGDKVEDMYNWYGQLKGGFMNAIFAEKGCTKTTDDFGYKVIDNDVYIYTGVTSTKSSSSSAVGFILVNSRTGEFTFLKIGDSTDETSAMNAAEGEVSDFGWKASFPSIINVNGHPTYILVLKDDNCIVKRYAMINVEHYEQIAIGKSQKEVFAKYAQILNGADPEDVKDIEEKTDADAEEMTEVEVPENAVSKDIVVVDIKFIVDGGNTTVYVQDDAGNYYKSRFDEKWITVNPGDVVNVTYTEDGDIHQMY